MSYYVKTHTDDAPTLRSVARVILSMRHRDVESLARFIDIVRSGGVTKSARKVRGEDLTAAADAINENIAEGE